MGNLITKTKKILITEDDPSFLRFMSYLLGKEGYEVLTASNGVEGLFKAQEEKPDLLILDIMLPGLDGFEVCNQLRTNPETNRLPILMLSAKGQDGDRFTGIDVGADEYLVKPVERAVLLNTIEHLLTKNQ
jgi:two-component system, OmpR family, alkaline phosphatase synthesis response regulator PhoP